MTASCGVLWVANLPNDCCSTSTTDTFRQRTQQRTSFVTLKYLPLKYKETIRKYGENPIL